MKKFENVNTTIKVNKVKGVLAKLVLGVIVLGIVYLVGMGVYRNWNRLAYAWDNPKVDWLMVADKETKNQADNKLKDGLSRVFIQE